MALLGLSSAVSSSLVVFVCPPCVDCLGCLGVSLAWMVASSSVDLTFCFDELMIWTWAVEEFRASSYWHSLPDLVAR